MSSSDSNQEEQKKSSKSGTPETSEDESETVKNYKAAEIRAEIEDQIERNNEWIEKMSPVVKYKIQEYIRKQKAKKMQRRKFSLACGLMSRRKQELPSTSTSSSSRRRSKKNTEPPAKLQKSSTSSGPVLGRLLSQREESRKTATISNRRKSAPSQKIIDMGDLDDLE